MNINKIKTRVFLLAGIVFAVIFDGITNARGAPAYIKTPVSMDAYVWADAPNTCYGHNGGLIIGNYTANWTETYVYFNLENRPAQWTSVLLRLVTYGINANLSGYFQETNTSWSEDTITWSNRPALLSYTEPMNITYPTQMLVNLTTFLHRFDAASDATNISLLLNSTVVADGNHSMFISRDPTINQGPHLYWYYEQEVPFDPAPIIIAVACIGLGIAVVAIVVKKRGKKKPAPEAAKPDEFDDLKFSA